VVFIHIRQWLEAGFTASSAVVTLSVNYQAYTLIVNWQVHETLFFDTMPV